MSTYVISFMIKRASNYKRRDYKFKMYRARCYYLLERGRKVSFPGASCQDVDQIYIFKEAPTWLPIVVKGG